MSDVKKRKLLHLLHTLTGIKNNEAIDGTYSIYYDQLSSRYFECRLVDD